MPRPSTVRDGSAWDLGAAAARATWVSTSRRVILPSVPVPVTRARSIPGSAARRRTTAERIPGSRVTVTFITCDCGTDAVVGGGITGGGGAGAGGPGHTGGAAT